MGTRTENRQKVLLIYPRFPERLPILSLPMGPLYVGSYLVSQGYEVVILDINNFGSDRDSLNVLKEELSSALVVGLSTMTSQIPNALKISEHVKQLAPSVPIIWGGVHPSLFPGQTAKCRYIDFAVKGEGEITMLELLKALDGQIELEDVKGIAFKSNNDKGVTVTDNRELVDINKLPPVSYTHLTLPTIYSV